MISDEIAVKLKEANFPQGTPLRNVCPSDCEFKDGMPIRLPSNKVWLDEYRKHMQEHRVFRPDLGVLVDACGEKLQYLKRTENTKEWVAGTHDSESEIGLPDSNVWVAISSEDAVSLLWLATRS